ncbi:hypothetical protein [Lysobacter firmicutimachus]|uniref:Uncharacterized protein n=1 Tax=Lysobacter firmicutimachus TaxID=1792846 RepID=A0ABU8CWH9_9GAMM
MNKSIKIAPPNSLILVMDHSFGEVPAEMGGQLVSSTDSCVAVGTLSEIDGETTITLTSDLQIEPGLEEAFNGIVQTPSGELSICNSRNEALISLRELSLETRIRILVNDSYEPDQIVVVAEPSS